MSPFGTYWRSPLGEGRDEVTTAQCVVVYGGVAALVGALTALAVWARC